MLARQEAQIWSTPRVRWSLSWQPESLLADRRIPDIPDEMAYADSVVLNLLMQGALEDCSNQLRAIKTSIPNQPRTSGVFYYHNKENNKC